MYPALVTPAFVAECVADSNVLIFDASLYENLSREQILHCFAQSHVASAAPLLLVSDASTSLVSVPGAQLFQQIVNCAGFEHGKRVLLYDCDGVSALRAWWLFQSYNYAHAGVMCCSFAEYARCGFPVEAGAAATVRDVAVRRVQLNARFCASLKCTPLVSEAEMQKFRLLPHSSHLRRFYDAEQHRIYEQLVDGAGSIETDIHRIRTLLSAENIQTDQHLTVECAQLRNGILIILALYLTRGAYANVSIRIK